MHAICCVSQSFRQLLFASRSGLYGRTTYSLIFLMLIYTPHSHLSSSTGGVFSVLFSILEMGEQIAFHMENKITVVNKK